MTRNDTGLDGPTDNSRDLGGNTPALDESTASEYLADPDAPLETELGAAAVVIDKTGRREVQA